MAGLPDGFVIDQAPGGGGTSAPGLPEGFTIDTPKAEALPDVGSPAIGDGGQFSPGIPAVNDYVNKTLAPSANNFVQNTMAPVLHPIDTATNLYDLGRGLLEKAGIVSGDEYEKYPDAVGQFFKDRYGSLDAVKKTFRDDPVGAAADLSAVFGLARTPGRLAQAATRTARVAAPTTEELFDAAEGHYNAMHGFGVEVHPQVMDDVATNVTTALKTQGFYPRIAPQTYSMIEELRNPDGPTFTTQQIESIRRGLNKVGPDASDRAAARQAITELDNTMAGLTPADAAVNGHFAPRVAQEASLARGDYAAAKRAEQIETATNNAELQAASTGSGANIDNATRQKIRSILTSPSKRRGFSQTELDQMDQLVRGTFTGNAARLLGKLAPSGIVSGALSAGLGHAVGHTAGVPVVGYVAKQFADAATRRAASRLSEQVRLRSPLARQIGAMPAPPRQVPPLPGPKAFQAGRLGTIPQFQNPYSEANQ